MALNFASTDRVDHSADSGMDDLLVNSMVAWFRYSSWINYASLLNKEPSGLNRSRWELGGTTGNLLLTFSGDAGANTVSTNTTGAPLSSADTWYYAAFTVDKGGAAGDKVRIYIGDLTTPAAVEAINANQDNAISSVANTVGLRIGNSAPLSGPFPGDIAILGFWANVRLSLEEIRAQQFSMFPSVNLSNLRQFCHYGWNGVGSQVDWSGNRNNGTVTGATLANHVPLGYVPPSAAKILQAEGRVEPFIMSRPGIV